MQIKNEGDNEISEDTTFYVRMTRSEIQKSARVKYDSPSEKTFFLGCINRKGLFGISENRSRTWYIKFVDTSDENVIEYITDYEYLALYYEKISGGRICQCKHCGKLFRQGKTKDSNYCYKHRGYLKSNNQTLTCIDCGNSFDVGSKSRETQRCKECQKKYRREYMRQLMAKKRSVV